jgi:deazaflavin-dependent oxidoreductase (nitroreductase family)
VPTRSPKFRDLRHWSRRRETPTILDVNAVAEPSAATLLPYGPLMTRLLRPLQRGFLFLNGGFMTPLLRSGFGWLIGNPFTGHLMLLRTRGRRTGLLREAPLGYVIRDGCVYCVAGYGEPTPWFRNLLADPAVEVVLPARRFLGRAEPVSDPVEWVAAYRALIASFGLIGGAIVGDVRGLDDATLLAKHRALPVIRITPTDGSGALIAGPFDPGGSGWLLPYGAALALGVLAWARFGPLRRHRER